MGGRALYGGCGGFAAQDPVEEAPAAQLDADVEHAKQTSQAQEIAQQNQLESARAQHQAELDAQLEAHKAAVQKATDDAQRQFDAWKAELDASTKISVAEIGAKTKIEAAELASVDAAADRAASTPGSPE